MLKATLTALLLAPTLAASLSAARLNPEAHYQEIAAKKYNGQTEVTMPVAARLLFYGFFQDPARVLEW